MADLKLKRALIRNWMKFKDVQLVFPDKGLVLVQGVNTASGGALMSVGSGKTGIGESISRTLLGVDGRFKSLKQYSTNKGGDTYVRVEAEFLSKPLLVESGYRCKELSPTGEALKYTYDGKTVQRATIQQTRDELSKLLSVSPLLASWTAFIDGDSIKFNKLSQADSVELVMSSLRQPPWSHYHEASKRTLGTFRRTLVKTELAQQNAAETLKNTQTAVEQSERAVVLERTRYEQAQAENNAQRQQLQKAISLSQRKITEAEKEMADIAKKLKVMENQLAEKSHKLEIELHGVEDAIHSAEQARKPFNDAKWKADQKAAECRMAYNNYAKAAKECPTCKRPLGKIDPARLQKLQEDLDAANLTASAAATEQAKAEQKVVTLNTQYRELSRQHRELSAKNNVDALADRNVELETEVSSLNALIHDYELEIARCQQGPSDAALRVAEQRCRDHKTALSNAQKAVEETAHAMAADQSTLKVLEYWNFAFSPYGIPNMVLRDAIAPLNKEARRVSAAMTGGTIDVRYSTTRELASGMEKAQLNIEVDNKLGDKDLNGSSKGEAGLTNFIIAETLSEIGQVSQRVGFIWFDEVLPHQDAKVCHSVYAYLKEKSQRLGILIFLVDHNSVAANYADHVLLVEKTGSMTKCESRVSWR